MDRVVRICEKYNINYYLSSGTLLGAVRHRVYIPWDDDIDMPIKDYKRFCKIPFQEFENEGLFLQIYHTNPEAMITWATVRANNTASMPVSESQLNIHWGAHIDVFPLIGLYKNLFLRKCQYGLLAFTRTLLEKDYIEKCMPNYTPSIKVKIFYLLPRNVIHLMVDLLNLCIDYDFWNADMGVQKWTNLDYLCNPDYYKSTVELEFEGNCYNSPYRYDEQIKLWYGDYLTRPPECERKGMK